MESERQRFEAQMVEKTIVPVGPHQQASARRLLKAGWCAYGEDVLIEAIGRPRRADCGGRIWGGAAREFEDVAA